MKSALAHLLIVIAAASFTWVCGFNLTAPVATAEWSTTEILSGHPRVIDGDTIEIKGPHVRLFGIDAPEHDQRCTRNGASYACGDEATKALLKKVGGKAVTCEQRDIDKYRHVVAVCTVSGEDINRWMVDRGHAVAYRQYSTSYVPDEERAKAAKRGLWAGGFEKPWDFRHVEHRTNHSEKPVTSSSKTHPCKYPADRDKRGHRCGKRASSGR